MELIEIKSSAWLSWVFAGDSEAESSYILSMKKSNINSNCRTPCSVCAVIEIHNLRFRRQAFNFSQRNFTIVRLSRLLGQSLSCSHAKNKSFYWFFTTWLISAKSSAKYFYDVTFATQQAINCLTIIIYMPLINKRSDLEESWGFPRQSHEWASKTRCNHYRMLQLY